MTQQEKENFYIVMKCGAIYIGRTFNLWLLLVQLLLLHCTYMTYIKTNIHLIFDLDG